MPTALPTAWLMPANMLRVICHWTAGGYHPSENDREHYHVLIDGDGQYHRGEHIIADNESAADGHYAAHTRGTNTGSIGISMCCMLNARERPFDAGPMPMREVQWNAMIDAVAQLCAFYGIAVTPLTVLGHGEVQKNLGRPQSGKWDPMRLPFRPELTASQVGNLLREQVAQRLAR